MKIGQLIPLPFETQAVMGVSHILRLTYQDVILLTSGTGQAAVPTNDLGAATSVIPIGMHVSKVIPNVVTAFAFSGANNGTLTGSLGDGGSATRFVNAQDMKTAAYGTSYTSKYVYAAADTIDVTFTAATQAITALTAGQVDFYLKLDDTSTLVNIQEPSAS
jgi:hypothetical protein